MSTEYHKISTPFKRHFDGPNKGKLIMGDWAVPELDYLSSNYWEFTEKVDGTNIRISLLRSTLINSGLEITQVVPTTPISRSIFWLLWIRFLLSLTACTTLKCGWRTTS